MGQNRRSSVCLDLMTQTEVLTVQTQQVEACCPPTRDGSDCQLSIRSWLLHPDRCLSDIQSNNFIKRPVQQVYHLKFYSLRTLTLEDTGPNQNFHTRDYIHSCLFQWSCENLWFHQNLSPVGSVHSHEVLLPTVTSCWLSNTLLLTMTREQSAPRCGPTHDSTPELFMKSRTNSRISRNRKVFCWYFQSTFLLYWYFMWILHNTGLKVINNH